MIELPNVFNGGFAGDLVESELRSAAFRRQRLCQLPFTLDEWNPAELRKKIMTAMGAEIDHSLPLDVEITKTIRCKNYSIHCLSYQSRPGFRVTANLYVPDGEGPFPGVINMHGHWFQGRLAANVQMRGHILAQCGYVVLAVDAFGSGERSPEHGNFSYHGGLLGGALFHVGESLMGIQVVDNMRGVDLLRSLPYVIKDRIGACGASGGGNQTMWLAAMDERITAAVPVVSVGTFRSYVLCVNCVCELLPGGLNLTEEAGVIALAAPRAIMPVNGLLDNNAAFNPAETRRTVDEAKRIFRAYGVPQNLRQMVTEEHHCFNRDTVRALIGWFDLHLKGIGDGEAVETAPEYEPLPEDELMVYPKGKRPASVISIPEYLKRREDETLSKKVFDPEKLESALGVEKITPRRVEKFSDRCGWERIGIEGSDHRLTPLLLRRPSKPGKSMVIVGTPYLKQHLMFNEMIKSLLDSGHGVALFDLWGCGENNIAFSPASGDGVYNRSLMWMGSSMQCKWVEDFRMVEQYLRTRFADMQFDAGSFKDGTVAAALFAAMRPEKTSLWLDSAPETLRYHKEQSANFSHAFLIPGILKYCDMSDLLEHAGGEIKRSGSRFDV